MWLQATLYRLDVRPQLLFSFVTFDSFLALLVKNQVYSACFSTQTVPEPV